MFLWSKEHQGKSNNDQPKVASLPVAAFSCAPVNVTGGKSL